MRKTTIATIYKLPSFQDLKLFEGAYGNIHKSKICFSLVSNDFFYLLTSQQVGALFHVSGCVNGITFYWSSLSVVCSHVDQWCGMLGGTVVFSGCCLKSVAEDSVTDNHAINFERR